jgi:hypothetical protein
MKNYLRKAKPLTYCILFEPMVQVENIVKDYLVVCLTKMGKEVS